jgi:hypothetical protein
MAGARGTRAEVQLPCDVGRTPWRMLTRRRLGAILVVTVALLLVTVTPASADTPLACGQVITADTTLQSDLVDCPGDGIVIGAHGIRLDLNGHTVSAAACDVDCVEHVGVANTGGYDRVRIVNGTISGFATNVSLVGATANTLANLTVGGFPISAPAAFVGVSLSDSYENRLRGITVEGGNPAVVLTSSDRNVIRRSSITGGVSIHVGLSLALSGSDDNLLADSQVGGESGITIFDSAGNRLLRNMFINRSEPIILGGVRQTVIANNRFSFGFGVPSILAYSADASLIVRNQIRGGIWFREGDENRIERNDVEGNVGLGIPGIVIDRGQANLIRSNRAVGVDGGIAVGPGASATQIVGNVANGSLDDGIDVDGPGTLVRANTANDNGDLGIEAIEGTIDGGGNRASGNGNPLQCVNVVCR